MGLIQHACGKIAVYGLYPGCFIIGTVVAPRHILSFEVDTVSLSYQITK